MLKNQLIKKTIVLLFLLPLFYCIGSAFCSLLPNKFFLNRFPLLSVEITTWLPFFLLTIYLVITKRVFFPKTKKGLALSVFSFLVYLPVCLFVCIYISTNLGERMYVGSPFISEYDLGSGKTFSFLQHRDAASFVSGKKVNWNEVGNQPVDKCESSAQYSPADCKFFQLSSVGHCYTCSFRADTQDSYYSLVYINGSQLTEFNSVNHDFLTEPPASLGKYFSLKKGEE